MPLPDRRFDKYNLHKIIIKPLYLGVLLNIILPGAILFVCYYLNINNSYTSGVVDFDNANTLFIVVAVLAIINSGLALWMRHKLFTTPLISSEESLEQDLTISLLDKIRPVYALISVISVYGVGYYFLTARFQESAFFVVFSFLVFQVVRPRIGYLQKLIDAQLKLIENGQLKKIN